jgi:hypothetical protein
VERIIGSIEIQHDLGASVNAKALREFAGRLPLGKMELEELRE